MHKGIVIERKKRYHIMLTSDGSFYKAQLENDPYIGEEVVFTPVEQTSRVLSFLNILQARNRWKALVTVVLSLALIAPLYFWMNSSQTYAYAYVNFDINPSIEFVIDESYDVISAEALNNNGSELLEDLDSFEGRSLEAVSSNVINLSRDLGYLEDDHHILLGVSYVEHLLQDEEPLLYSLSSQLLSEFDEDINIASFEVPEDLREEATKKNTSMNLMYATEVLYGEEDEGEKTEQVVHQRVDDDESIHKTNQDERIEGVLARFLDRTNRDELPPDLQKKIDEDRLTELIEELEGQDSGDIKGNREGDSDSSNNREQESSEHKNDQNEHNQSQRNHDQGNNQGQGNNNGNSGNENSDSDNNNSQSNNNGNGDQNEEKSDDDHPVFGEDGPPGKRSGEEHPGNGGNGNGKTPPGKDSDFVPPGQDDDFVPPGQRNKTIK
ncbi:anti-sigma factor domain-containing protein [Alkalibacillus silvisoli]|uniref:Anti-sigma-I factor RsgI n=1 Tax=Alkalibacillus silvisoli TaxID=392823 RepID=A0ABP3K4Z1_9BACI